MNEYIIKDDYFTLSSDLKKGKKYSWDYSTGN